MRVYRLAVLLCLVSFLAACGGGGSTQTGSQSAQPTVTLSSITVDAPNASMFVGKTQQLKATGKYSDGTTKDLTSTATWTSSAGSATVSTAGVVTGVSAGSATITASSGSVSGTTSISVVAVTLSSIAVTPTSASLAAGLTKQYTATGTYNDGSTQKLTSVAWSSSDTSKATVDNNGLVTAKAAGSATITATSGSISAGTDLTVTPPVLYTITVVPATASVAKGQTQQYAANGFYSDGSEQDVTAQVAWTTNPGTVATIEASALAKGAGVGNASITATYGTGTSAVSGSATLTVTAAVLTAVDVAPDLATVPMGGTQQYVATGTYSDGSTQDVDDVAWKVTTATPDGAAKIDPASGLATGLLKGSAYINGTVSGISDVTDAELDVTDAVLTGIAITPANPSISTIGSQQFVLTGTFSDGSTQDLTAVATWASDNTAVATIDSTGLAVPVVNGTAKISASYGGFNTDTTLTVTGAKLMELIVTPANPEVGIGAPVQFTATGSFDDGSTQDMTSFATWTSSYGSVATISASGLATSVSKGTTTIAASFRGVSGSTVLTVTAATLESISILPDSPTMAHRTKLQLTAWGNYNDGTKIRLVGVTWTSNHPNIAMVSGSGLLRSKGKTGSVTVNAYWGGSKGTTTVTVTSHTVQTLTITPASVQIAAGTTAAFQAIAMLNDGVTTQDVTKSVYWSTSNATNNAYSYATVNAGVVKGLRPGIVTVKACYGSLCSTATLTITDATLSSIRLAPANPIIPLGTSQQFSATGVFSDDTEQDLTNSTTWASSDLTVAILSTSMPGFATSSGRGNTQVTATVGGVTGTTLLTVQ